MSVTTNALIPLDDLILQQMELETEMTQQGIDRMRSNIVKAKDKGREDETVYGTRLLDALLDKVVDGLTVFMKEREAGYARNKGAAYKFLKGFDGDYKVVAFITLRMVIGGLTGKMVSVPSIAGRIGRAIEDEFRYRHVREGDAKFYAKLQDEADKRSSYAVKRTVVNLHINRREVDMPDGWAEKDLVAIGLLLIETVINTTGLVKTTKIETSKNTSRVVLEATEETHQFIKDRVASAEVMRPLYEPMIVTPVSWEGPSNGGYLTRRVRPLRLVKSYNKRYLAALESQDMSEVCEAVNVAQATAWAINPFILTVQEIAWEKDYSLGGVPNLYNLPMPPKPFDIEDNEVARKAWRTEAHGVHLENLELTSKRCSFTTALNIARRYSMFPAIFFPYQLDFRGRIYAAPQLNPQGPDWMKALLQFSEGKALDDESAPFLAIHLANCGDFKLPSGDKASKAPLEDRVQWVYDHEQEIIDCAENPFDNRWWTEADSPYCFLAAAREWAGWIREGAGFLSHLAVALDGSCSGIQHFSMALADEVGGAAVNLVPSEKPADIYSLVMRRAIERITADASGADEDKARMAGEWLRSGLLIRNTFKRPTMTYGYGSGRFGFRDQILEDTLRPALKAHKRGTSDWHFEGDGYLAANYLAQVAFEAIEATVLKAAEAMHWLKEVAKVVTSENLPVRWTTPDGFVVVQNYQETKSNRIDTVLFGKRVTAYLDVNLPTVDKRKQASGFSPNFVHSLDATHLRLTVRRAAEEGIKSFALVHDSFGTHAADTGRFFAILRETMIEMYRGRDLMDNLRTEVEGQLSPENAGTIPLPPTLGTLDIEAVIDCDFAFA